eukprot:gb/GECG01013109.1/.p1 GENE.gb/GECG01013109.1/~~gb/GECG01013109.1/.p1  ORF type:complete len:226 (+),score=31.64 gb/GECG01013109.1/:1-678(+)
MVINETGGEVRRSGVDDEARLGEGEEAIVGDVETMGIVMDEPETLDVPDDELDRLPLQLGVAEELVATVREFAAEGELESLAVEDTVDDADGEIVRYAVELVVGVCVATIHWLFPSLDICPGGQSSHADSPELNFPGGQAPHVVLPESVSCPLPQLLQLLDPLESEYFPDEHLLQDSPRLLKYPFGHFLHPEPRVNMLPLSHSDSYFNAQILIFIEVTSVHPSPA